MALRKALNRFAVDESGWLESERRGLVETPMQCYLLCCAISSKLKNLSFFNVISSHQDIDQKIIQNKPLKQMP